MAFAPTVDGTAHGYVRAVVEQLGTADAPLQLAPVRYSSVVTEEDASLQVFVDGRGVAPSLHFEVAGSDDALVFTAELAKFLTKPLQQRKYVLIRNPTSAQLSFRLAVSAPFSFTDAALVAANGVCSLAANGSLTVGLGCTFVHTEHFQQPRLSEGDVGEGNVGGGEEDKDGVAATESVIEGELTATTEGATTAHTLALRAVAHRAALQSVDAH